MAKKIILAVLISATAVFLIISMQNNSTVDKINVKIGDSLFKVEVADEESERIQGLSGREGLETDGAMLFIFESAGEFTFWMKGMKFPLDIVWINGNEVIGVSENLPPDNTASPKIYAPPGLIDKALEINAGEVQKRGIRKGDKVEILNYSN